MLNAAVVASKSLAIAGHVTLYKFDGGSGTWFKEFDCNMAGQGLTAQNITLAGPTAIMSVPGNGACTIGVSPTNTIVKPASVPTGVPTP
jgi:hypothetical protein